jgi:hypothetical protein
MPFAFPRVVFARRKGAIIVSLSMICRRPCRATKIDHQKPMEMPELGQKADNGMSEFYSRSSISLGVE